MGAHGGRDNFTVRWTYARFPNVRSDSVNVEQKSWSQIRAGSREKSGVDYTEQQIRELDGGEAGEVLTARASAPISRAVSARDGRSSSRAAEIRVRGRDNVRIRTGRPIR